MTPNSFITCGSFLEAFLPGCLLYHSYLKRGGGGGGGGLYAKAREQLWRVDWSRSSFHFGLSFQTWLWSHQWFHLVRAIFLLRTRVSAGQRSGVIHSCTLCVAGSHHGDFACNCVLRLPQSMAAKPIATYVSSSPPLVPSASHKNSEGLQVFSNRFEFVSWCSMWRKIQQCYPACLPMSMF